MQAAGISIDALLLRAQEEQIQAQLDVNLRGSIHVTQAALRVMQPLRSEVV